MRDFRVPHGDALPNIRCNGRSANQARRIQGTSLHQEDDVKELELEEVLRIAGGVPVAAALDELTYRAPEQSAGDAVDYARLLGLRPRESEPV